MHKGLLLGVVLALFSGLHPLAKADEATAGTLIINGSGAVFMGDGFTAPGTLTWGTPSGLTLSGESGVTLEGTFHSGDFTIPDGYQVIGSVFELADSGLIWTTGPYYFLTGPLSEAGGAIVLVSVIPEAGTVSLVALGLALFGVRILLRRRPPTA